MEKYKSYKPSGIEWIGDIPEHWDVEKTKFVSLLNTGNSLNTQQKELYGEVTEDVPSRPYIASKDIERDTEFIDYDNGIRIPINESGFEIAPANSALLCIEGGSAGKKMGFVDREVCFVNKLCCFNSFGVNSKYHYYFIKSKPFWEAFSQNLQGMIGGVSVGVLKDIKLPVPSPTEQDAIVAYLDSRCADIDKVIATQEKRIDLLKELKQSAITEAVTKGLNPNAEMKDSGVEWVGKVPAHWDIMPFKFRMDINNGMDYKSIQADEGYPVMGSGGQFAYATKYMYDGEVVLLGRKGTVDKPLYYNGKFWAVDTMFYAIPKQGAHCKYMYYQATTFPFAYYQTATALPSMTQTDLGNNKVCVPPISEQKEIADYLDSRCTEFDRQINGVTRQIELLREYKQSLITEVVTGKRKVC